MTIPTLNSVPANRATLPPEQVSQSKKKPIEAGVDSHKIKFDLGSTITTKVETVVGASFDRPDNHDSLISLAPRLKELATSGASLVSFASTPSFERLTQQGKPAAPLHLNSTSMIERLQASLTSKNGNGLKLSDEITVMSVTIKPRGTDPSGIPYLEGKINIRSSDPKLKHKTIKFLEFSPKYDGRSLNKDTLLNALQHVPNKNAASADVVHPHFYSMNGIGRSASLAVLYSFKKMCEENKGFTDGEVEVHLDTLIKQGRNLRDTHFVNTGDQRKELLNACITLNNIIVKVRKLGERKSTVRLPTKPKPAQRKPAKPVPTEQTPTALKSTAPKPTVRLSTERISTEAKPAELKTTVTMHAKRDLWPPAITRQPLTRTLAVNSTTAPPVTIEVSDAIKDLVKGIPTFISNPGDLPYMPIKLEGIRAIANNAEEFPFPQVKADQAKKIAKDIIWAGFYGDALGSDLETHFFKKPTGDETPWPSKQQVLEGPRRNHNPIKDEKLIAQLKQTNAGGHMATDDTQQGVLSAMATMKWMSSKVDKDQNDLGNKIRATFQKPAFPDPKRGDVSVPSRIRGGAETIRMCQLRKIEAKDWYKVAIEGFEKDKQTKNWYNTGTRAGAAGNGGMMRIGYDLLPLLASGASMQDLVEQALISNQVTHPSSFSAVACVGQVVLMAKCIQLRLEAKNLPDKKLNIPDNFFINIFHKVAELLEHHEQKFVISKRYSVVPKNLQSEFTPKQWQTPRLPSEFLKAPKSSAVIKAGSVEQALIDSQGMGNSSEEIDSVLQRWSSDAYLGATFPTVVFLLEKFGREDSANAVNMAALVTKDSDTCATIIAQVMGALHGSDWVDQQLKNAGTFHRNLGNDSDSFTVDNFIDHVGKFYEQQAKKHTA